MNQKQLLIAFTLMFLGTIVCLPMQSQSIWFRFNGGLEEAYNLSDIQKLTYGSEQNPAIAVHLIGGDVISYNYSDVVSYYFSDSSVSVTERELLNHNRLLVYPNPAGDLITVSWLSADSGPFQIALRDMEGRIIETHQVTNGSAGLRNLTLNLQHVQTGIYICQLIGKSSIQSTRLIKN